MPPVSPLVAVGVGVVTAELGGKDPNPVVVNPVGTLSSEVRSANGSLVAVGSGAELSIVVVPPPPLQISPSGQQPSGTQV